MSATGNSDGPAPGRVSHAAHSSERAVPAETPPDAAPSTTPTGGTQERSPEPSPVAFADERPAAQHLASSGATPAWERRAEWLEAEAKAQRDPSARARLLLAASEVRALLGGRADARRLALQAASLSVPPPFAARQARALQQTHGDFSAVLKSLPEEARTAKTPAIAAHAHYLMAEISRLLHRDLSAAEAGLEAAEQSEPTDSRVTLQRLVHKLAQSQKPPELSFRPDDAIKPLRQATALLRQLRGAQAPRLGLDDVSAVPLVEAQRALSGGRPADAALAISQLESQPGLRAAAQWLGTLWRAAAPARSEDVLSAFRKLARDNPGREERRALAARALAAGDWDALREALDEHGEAAAAKATPTPVAGRSNSPARPAFSTVERLSLAALMGRPVDSSAVSARPAEDLALKPLTSAIERAAAATPALGPSATPVEAEFALGRAVARLQRFSELEASSIAGAGFWSLALRLEQSREAKDFGRLSRDLTRLFQEPGSAAECSFVAGVCAEKAGDAAAARERFQASMLSPISREAAVRALSEGATDSTALLRALSAHCNDPPRRALLLTEALLRLDPAAPEFDALAEEAARTYPELPFAQELGEVGARMRGDRSRVARWLAKKRERAHASGDFSLASLLEALFLVQTDRALGAERLRELAGRDVTNLALQFASERAGEVAAREKADFRRQAAASLSARGRERLLAEAVRLYEGIGDVRAAVSTARELGGPLAELWVERLATEPADLDWLAASLGRTARQTREPGLAGDLYERLARLELSRGRREQALIWLRERVAVEPASLQALRSLDIDSMLSGREVELERTAQRSFELLGEHDGLAYAFLATRLKIARGAFQDARPLVRRACTVSTPPLWALRLESAYARDAGDDRSLLAVYRTLRERAGQPLDAAALSLRAAEAAARLGQTGLAKDEIERASELLPDSVVILSARAEVLRSHADYAEAAEAFETLASVASSKTQRTEALYQAGLIWLDTLGHRARGVLALQEAAALDVAHPGLLARLRELHAKSEDFDGLTELIERQRARAKEPGPTSGIELARALELSQTEHLTAARVILDSLLERQPKHLETLSASAELHLRLQNWAGAERDFRRVVELGAQGSARLAALRGLASLYEKELASVEQTRAVYQAILEQDPADFSVRRRLIANYVGRERWEEAIGQQRALLEHAPGDEERRQYLLELVELLDKTLTGRAEAEVLLERAHRTWPDHPRVLESEVEHYQRRGDHGAARVILERSTNAARNAILAGRLEPALFRTLEVASRLGGDLETARTAHAGLGAIRGQPTGLGGAGAIAGDPRFDDLIAPAPLSAGFRRLLYAAGAAIERAYAIDPRSLDPSPLSEPMAARVRRTVLAFGIDDAKIMVSPQLGFECVCLHAQSQYVVFGQRLLDHDKPLVLDFLLFRALKIAQANACALSRMAPIDLWPVVAGFLACFAPPWQADGLDAQRLVAARNKIRPHVTATPEPELTQLISAMTANLVPQAAQVGEALWRWATRVALFGIGDPALALEGLWLCSSLGPVMPKELDSRVRWIANQPHARDLVGYGVSDAYIEARARAGLTVTLG